MDRRRFLHASGCAAFLTGLSGCQGLVDDIAGGTPTPQDRQAGPSGQQEPNPTVTWSESLVENGYKVTVDVQLDGLEEIEIQNLGTSTITTISSNGQHTIFGPNTERGVADIGAMGYQAVYMKQIGEDGPTVPEVISSHQLGSREEPSMPLHLATLSGHTAPDLEQSGLERQRRVYNQDVGIATETELTLNVPTVLAEYYGSRTRTRQWGAYVSDSFDDQYINSVVGEFEQYGEDNGLSNPEIINHMMRFVQNLEYSKDIVSEGYNEYPKYPIETLVDKGGDCEDTAILLAAMLEQFGYGAVLLEMPEATHMALGIAGEDDLPGSYYTYEGRRYYYIEPTAPGWGVGEVPPNAEGVSANIHPINSSPVLVFAFSVDLPTAYDGSVSVETSIRNVGDATASNASIRIFFETPSGNQVAAQRSGSHTIPPQESVSPTLDFTPPSDQPLRIRARVGLDGRLHDETVSEVAEPSEFSMGE